MKFYIITAIILALALGAAVVLSDDSSQQNPAAQPSPQTPAPQQDFKSFKIP